MCVLGTRVPRRLGVARSASSPKAAQALGCSLTPGLRISFGPWHGLTQCPGFGHWDSYCCVVLVFGSGLWLGVGFRNPASPGWGLGRVCFGWVCGVVPFLPARVCGVRGWARVSACTPPLLVGDMGHAWLRARSACTPPFPVPVCGVGVRAGVWVSAAPRHSLGGVGVCVCLCARPPWFLAPPGRGCCAGVRVCARALLVPRLSRLGCAVWACVLGPGLGCAPLFLVGLSGCVFFCASCFGFVVLVAGCPCPGPCGPCPPIPSLSGWVAGAFFFLSERGVCLRALVVPSPGGPLLLVWCCRLWLGGPFVLLWGSCLRCFPAEGFGRPLWCWRAIWWLWVVLSPPPSPPVFFWGGSACSSLRLPWAGARTGLHSVRSSGLLLAVAFCLAASRPHGSGGLCTHWARRPFLPGQVLALPAGRLRQAASCGSGLGGWNCPCLFSSAVPVLTFWVVRHLCCRARYGPVCGPRCRCAVCWCGAFRGVRWLVLVSPSG